MDERQGVNQEEVFLSLQWLRDIPDYHAYSREENADGLDAVNSPGRVNSRQCRSKPGSKGLDGIYPGGQLVDLHRAEFFGLQP